MSDVIREGHSYVITPEIVFARRLHLRCLISQATIVAKNRPGTATAPDEYFRPSLSLVEWSLFSRLEYYDNFCETASKANHNLAPETWRLAEASSRLSRRFEQTNAEQDKSARRNPRQRAEPIRSLGGEPLEVSLLTFLLEAEGSILGPKPRSEQQ